MIGEVLSVERVEEDGAHGTNIKVDLGGGDISQVEYFPTAGDDSPPLPGDFAHCSPASGTGGSACGGFTDPKNAGKADGGEVRRYARDASGTPVSEIWGKNDGSVDVHSLKSGARLLMKPDGSIELVSGSGPVVINGVSFENGNVSAPGEVTAMANGPGVKLSTHLHGTAIGPSMPPTAGS